MGTCEEAIAMVVKYFTTAIAIVGFSAVMAWAIVNAVREVEGG